MATELISPGVITSIVQNQVYALPQCECVLTTDATTPTLQQSLTQAFTANLAITLTGGSATVSGGFLKLTTAGPINVLLKRD